jgi:hypothetical protein
MKHLLPPLLAIGGFVAYFLVTTRLGIYRSVPWEYLAVIAAGAGLGAWRLARAPGLASGLSALLSAGVLGFALWYLLGYSMYAAREERPRAGDRFPDFTLADSTGGSFHLGELRGKRVLLLFYRGDW